MESCYLNDLDVNLWFDDEWKLWQLYEFFFSHKKTEKREIDLGKLKLWKSHIKTYIWTICTNIEEWYMIHSTT